MPQPDRSNMDAAAHYAVNVREGDSVLEAIGHTLVSVVLQPRAFVHQHRASSACLVRRGAVSRRRCDDPPSSASLSVHRLEEVRLEGLSLLDQDDIGFGAWEPLPGSGPRIRIGSVDGPVAPLPPRHVIGVCSG